MAKKSRQFLGPNRLCTTCNRSHTRGEAVFPGILVSSFILQCTFPPLSVQNRSTLQFIYQLRAVSKPSGYRLRSSAIVAVTICSSDQSKILPMSASTTAHLPTPGATPPDQAGAAESDHFLMASTTSPASPASPSALSVSLSTQVSSPM